MTCENSSEASRLLVYLYYYPLTSLLILHVIFFCLSRQTKSIPYLLMPCSLASPGHQQLWYWGLKRYNQSVSVTHDIITTAYYLCDSRVLFMQKSTLWLTMLRRLLLNTRGPTLSFQINQIAFWSTPLIQVSWWLFTLEGNHMPQK